MTDLKLTRVETGMPGAAPETDWSVRCDGRLIARSILIDAGPQTGRWKWSGMCLPTDVGHADNLDEALTHFKASATFEKLETPALEPPEWTVTGARPFVKW